MLFSFRKIWMIKMPMTIVLTISVSADTDSYQWVALKENFQKLIRFCLVLTLRQLVSIQSEWRLVNSYESFETVYYRTIFTDDVHCKLIVRIMSIITHIQISFLFKMRLIQSDSLVQLMSRYRDSVLLISRFNNANSMCYYFR